MTGTVATLTDVLMPALELAQETGKILRWLKAPGDRVAKGEPLVEIETDKITTEIEAPASGVLREVTGREGEDVPVGRSIAVIAADAATAPAAPLGSGPDRASAMVAGLPGGTAAVTAPPMSAGPASPAAAIKASPLARKIASEHGVDLAQVRTASGRIEKADVLAHIESRRLTSPADEHGRRPAASPKARRLAAERGLDLSRLRGSGPDGAVLASDVGAARHPEPSAPADTAAPRVPAETVAVGATPEATPLAAPPLGTVWRVMAERMTASWTTAPHFYLVREVAVGRLRTWRERVGKQTGARVTYTDLLVKLIAAALRLHPEVNVAWRTGAIVPGPEINIGLAVAIDAGLVVPVLHRADTLDVPEIAARREDLVSRAQTGKLRPADIQGGTFTISNLGMYGVDAFSAVLNPPQAAILAVGRIADRVVARDGQPVVQPTMLLTLSCDHRAIDGARGAGFLGALADLIEEPLALLV